MNNFQESAMAADQGIESIALNKITTYFNATELCQFSGRRINNYLRSSKTRLLLVKLGQDLGLSPDNLVRSRKGGLTENSGTFLHACLKSNFMEWLAAPQTKTEEKLVQARLCAALGGYREVPHSVGFIDLLTDIELIEVKEVRRWMQGVGQLLVYGQDYPRHQKRLHLFGVASPSKQGIIKSYCIPLKIQVTWEEN